MPFGNLRRLGVAVALAAKPVLLLLDEPAAGLSDNEANTLDRTDHQAAADGNRGAA